mgnify:CR=1 FL=1
MSETNLLVKLGWQAFFQQQLTLDEWEDCIPARIVEQHKTQISVSTEHGLHTISLTPSMIDMVVGDWILLGSDFTFIRLLERKTYFARKAAGSHVKQQLISANVDVAFIVTSVNDDFNLNRIERFLALVNEAGAEPVVILSKSDLSLTPEIFVEKIRAIDPLLTVEMLNCLDSKSCIKLKPWLNEGSTCVMLGSSGVGKSTLTNTLLGKALQTTSDIRNDDAKGRHTTTGRSLFYTDSGGLILDTPGMREIQLSDCKSGIVSTFNDIDVLSMECQFKDCQHQQEPGCRVQQAIDEGLLDNRRLNNYLKLLNEESRNSASLSERRANDKALGKYYKKTQHQASKFKGR